MEDDSKIKILFMAANPSDRDPLRYDKEYDCIREAVVNKKDWKLVAPKLSIEPSHLSELLLHHEPHLVHFSGHGQGRRRFSEYNSLSEIFKECDEHSRNIGRLPGNENDVEGIIFEDSKGHAKLVSSYALGKIFKCFESRIVCVVLNACHSVNSAIVIINHIPFAIGMGEEIQDQAAIAFSDGFYKALGERKSIQRAYELGCAEIAGQGIEGDLTPALKINARISDFINKIPPHLKFLFQEENDALKAEDKESKKVVYQAVLTFEVDEIDLQTIKALVAHIGKIGKDPKLTLMNYEIEEDSDV